MYYWHNHSYDVWGELGFIETNVEDDGLILYLAKSVYISIKNRSKLRNDWQFEMIMSDNHILVNTGDINALLKNTVTN